MNELEFEKKLINYVSTGNINIVKEESKRIGEFLRKSSRIWQYEPTIKTTNALWENFRNILYRLNQRILDKQLSDTEFAQVKNVISNLKTPYEAGQFLYGLNGISQIDIKLDDGRNVFLTVFDQKQIGAGDTFYQVVTQIERPAKIIGRPDRRFDTTFLINGLPIIQIEEKIDTHDINEALNQMQQYIHENQYSDIFSTLQILVAMNANDVKYMANTTADKFNKDFSFHWQDDKNKKITNWKQFADEFLSIPMAHNMSTNYMILDGSKNDNKLIVMRSYQVHATESVLKKVRNTDFSFGKQKLGYVWHTTGSGKTITSFKTAWLLSRQPNVDKVVFVVDRKALTSQTFESYRAYDPSFSEGDKTALGSIQDTKNTSELQKRLKSKDNSIVVTSVQKLNRLIKRENFKAPDKNIVFVVDEAHRSTGGDSFKNIQNAFKHSAWVGYTGTPKFDDDDNDVRTEDIFGPPLHKYTIKNAIADGNVLGFKVDFETTITDEQIKNVYLPNFYKREHPTWSKNKIKEKIDNLSEDDMDDNISKSFYDNNEDHVRLVVKDIFEKWRNRSSNFKYSAILTTNTGGMGASTPMVNLYYEEFKKVNRQRKAKGEPMLNVAVSYSYNTSNDNSMVKANEKLFECIKDYNETFSTSFGLDDVNGYMADLSMRIRRKAADKKHLDLLIVVDQFLTGFDAPTINTLYVDRTLKGANLIQSYSRTNRIHDMRYKPFGRIVNYRWPSYNEREMDKALRIYSNDQSSELKELEDIDKGGVVALSYDDQIIKVKNCIQDIKDLTNDLEGVPPSERVTEELYHALNIYNREFNKLTQYEPDENGKGFDYNEPEKIYEELGIKEQQDNDIKVRIKNEVKRKLAENIGLTFEQIELEMTHIKDVRVNYDYLTELIENLINQVNDDNIEEVEKTEIKINEFANKLDDERLRKKILNAVTSIIRREYKIPKGKNPINLTDSSKIIEEANITTIEKEIDEFIKKWGLIDVVNSRELRLLFETHDAGKNDLDSYKDITRIKTDAAKTYKEKATDEILKNTTKVRYRNQLQAAIYKLADRIVEQL
ncbi:MAG: HsdR family type I site-specific deoxyribonuclease [Tissierellia bacterium]|nr:HsdR family type I site-specific deoxyribonuclease [Tissierellia bacterium]